MIRVYAETDRDRAWVAEGLGSRSWESLESFDNLDQIGYGDVVVAVVGDIAPAPTRATIAGAARTVPLVLCVRWDPDSAAWRAGLAAKRIIWRDEPAENVGRAAADIASMSGRLALADRLEGARVLERPILTVVLTALRAERPPLTRQGLARPVACSVSTLCRRWNKQVLPLIGMSPHVFVQHVLITHGRELRENLESWGAVAKAMEVDLRTLQAAAGEAWECTLEETAKRDLAEVWADLDRALRPLRHAGSVQAGD